MTFFVAVFHEVRKELLDRMLTEMRGDFATSRRVHPGRRHSRIFQRRDQENFLVSVAEWDTRQDYERLLHTPAYRRLTVEADPPARIEYLTRMLSFMQMSIQPSVVACETLSCPPEHADALDEFLRAEARRTVKSTDGLLGYEVYRLADSTGRYLAVHSWQSMVQLERFRAVPTLDYLARLDALSVVLESFIGMLAVRYSRFDAPPDAPTEFR